MSVRSYRLSAASWATILDDGCELFVAFERPRVVHLLDLTDLERVAAEALNTINRLHQPELLPQNFERLVLGIGQEPCNQAPTTAAHAIEIDLGFSDLPRVLQPFGSAQGPEILRSPRPQAPAKDRENRNIQAMRKRISRRASLSRHSLGPGARSRVGAIGSLLAIAGQGDPPLASPVSTSRNSASSTSFIALCIAAPSDER
jgi:hypothetical protein